MNTDASIGIVAPVLRSRANPQWIESAGITYHELTGRMRHVQGQAAAQLCTADAPSAVRAVSGCVMLIRRPLFEAIGMFNEDFFYSFEDIDFCLRADRAGFSTTLANTSAYHQGGRSAGQSNIRPIYFSARNHLMMNRTLPGGGVWKHARLGIIVGLNVASALVSSHQSIAAGLRDVWVGYRDYRNGRFGNPAS